ncbi:MAG TPA: YrhB domain-containing protein [Chthonomonadaceae bacterium]|nr:YrhB domain-containing protein [Chthonomonadaceae bacterium]
METQDWSDLHRHLSLADAALTGAVRAIGEGRLAWALDAIAGAQDKIAAAVRQIPLEEQAVVAHREQALLEPKPAPPALGLEAAQQKVTEYIHAVVDQSRYKDDPERAPMIGSVLEKDYGWVFTWNARKFLETQDEQYLLTGTRPILIEKESGEMRVLTFWWERDLQKYEAQRGQVADTNGHVPREVSPI